MKPKTVAIITTLPALTGLFLAFQNFTFEKDKTNKTDLSSMIEDSELQRTDVQAEVQKQAPPKKVDSEGLTATGKMKRVRIEGSEESVTVNDSSPLPGLPSPERDPANTFDRDLKRVEEELDAGN